MGPVRREAPEGPVARGEGRVVRVRTAECAEPLDHPAAELCTRRRPSSTWTMQKQKLRVEKFAKATHGAKVGEFVKEATDALEIRDVVL